MFPLGSSPTHLHLACFGVPDSVILQTAPSAAGTRFHAANEPREAGLVPLHGGVGGLSRLRALMGKCSESTGQRHLSQVGFLEQVTGN